jgi:hypothetical protein
MKVMTTLDRILLLVMCLLAAYQVVVGVEGLDGLPTWSYTAAFGVLLIAGLLLIIFGFEILESPLVVVVAAIIPLSLSLGLVSQYLPGRAVEFAVFTIGGFLAILITRYLTPGRIATLVLAVVHGVAGLVIFGLPVYLSLTGVTPVGFVFVGVGGALIGVGGLLLAFMRTGKPILSQKTIYRILPGLLLLTTGAFVAGMAVV